MLWNGRATCEVVAHPLANGLGNKSLINQATTITKSRSFRDVVAQFIGQ